MPCDAHMLEIPGKTRGWTGSMIIFRGQLYRTAWVEGLQYVLEYPCGTVVRVSFCQLQELFTNQSDRYYGLQEPTPDVLVMRVTDDHSLAGLALCDKRTGNLRTTRWLC